MAAVGVHAFRGLSYLSPPPESSIPVPQGISKKHLEKFRLRPVVFAKRGIQPEKRRLVRLTKGEPSFFHQELNRFGL